MTPTRRIYDLSLFLDDAVAAVAYVEDVSGWMVVAKEQREQPYDSAFDAFVEYRGYVEPDEDQVREVVRAFYDAEYDELDTALGK